MVAEIERTDEPMDVDEGVDAPEPLDEEEMSELNQVAAETCFRLQTLAEPYSAIYDQIAQGCMHLAVGCVALADAGLFGTEETEALTDAVLGLAFDALGVDLEEETNAADD